MFGMEKKGKKKGLPKWEFDLEKQLLENPNEVRKLKDHSDQCILQLKGMLRQGEDKKVFDETQTLLHGYLAAQKVLQRIGRK